MDEDTVMTEFGEERADTDSDEDEDGGRSELERELARREAADRPAPLFARKEGAAAAAEVGTVDPIRGLAGSGEGFEEGGSGGEEAEEGEQSLATLQGEEAGVEGGLEGERLPYETEADGTPVVGDLLKMR
ncbi:sporulation-induced protein, partial [Teratosphaeriaceae sp. CCFEE 6253]